LQSNVKTEDPIMMAIYSGRNTSNFMTNAIIDRYTHIISSHERPKTQSIAVGLMLQPTCGKSFQTADLLGQTFS